MIETITTPSRDWLPVFLPGMYEFGYNILEYGGFTDGVIGEPSTHPGKTTIGWATSDTPRPDVLAYTHFTFAEDSDYYPGLTFPVISFFEDVPTGTRFVILDAATPADDLNEFPIKYSNGTLFIGDPLAAAPALMVKIEVSPNGVDFSAAITAGIAMLPANAANEYAFNPHAYLESLFEPGQPVLGIDHNLFKYYRLLVGPVDTFDGTTGTPSIVTTPMRVLYASEVTELGMTSTTLSILPFTPNTSAFGSIKTVIAASVVSNEEQEPDLTKACPAWPIHLYWLNRKGGWNSHVFNGKHEYQEDIPEAQYFEDFLGYQHKAAIKGMKNAVSVFSGFIPSDRYDMVRTIRSAIRVFQAVETGFKEVNIKGGTFPIRKEANRLYECNFAFTYAEPVIIQTA